MDSHKMTAIPIYKFNRYIDMNFARLIADPFGVFTVEECLDADFLVLGIE